MGFMGLLKDVWRWDEYGGVNKTPILEGILSMTRLYAEP